jgi:hypothetical protein
MTQALYAHMNNKRNKKKNAHTLKKAFQLGMNKVVYL